MFSLGIPGSDIEASEIPAANRQEGDPYSWEISFHRRSDDFRSEPEKSIPGNCDNGPENVEVVAYAVLPWIFLVDLVAGLSIL